MLKFCIGMLIIIETFIFGCTWFMGCDLTFKEKMKIAIEMNVFVGALFFGFYLMTH
jgi:hypothetical protein